MTKSCIEILFMSLRESFQSPSALASQHPICSLSMRYIGNLKIRVSHSVVGV